MKLSHILTTMILSCGLGMAMPVLADAREDLDKAKTYYQNQNYTQAFAIFKRLAEQGNAVAQFRLGELYDRGEGVEQDKGQAFKLYTKAAEQGIVDAQSTLGWIYNSDPDFSGFNVKRNSTMAIKWYQKAAEQGDGRAASSIGSIYYHGSNYPNNSNDNSVNEDKSAAKEWYKKGCDLGDKLGCVLFKKISKEGY